MFYILFQPTEMKEYIAMTFLILLISILPEIDEITSRLGTRKVLQMLKLCEKGKKKVEWETKRDM